MFAETVDPDIFYRSPIHESACAELFAAAKAHGGLLVLSGEPGTGKTLVLRRVARDLERAGRRVFWFSCGAPLLEVLSPLGEEPSERDTTTPLGLHETETLLAALETRVRSEGAAVLAVDEAQQLEPQELRVLRDLAETGLSGTPLPVLLVGQPGLDVELARLVEGESGRAAALHVRLSLLEASDVRAYVAYRLEQAGLRLDDVFQADAVERVAAYAEGIPRVINQLCDAALQVASQAGLPAVSASTVDAGARWLDLDRSILPVASSAGWQPDRPMRSAATQKRRAWTAGVGVLILMGGGLLYTLRQEPSAPSPKLPVVKVPPQPVESLGIRAPQVAQPGPPAMVGAVERPPPQPPPLGAVEKPPPPTVTREAVKPPQGVGNRHENQQLASAETGHGMGSETAEGIAALGAASRSLLDAAEAGSLTEVRALLQGGVAPNVRDAIGMTPLMASVIHGHGEVAGLLLAHGAAINAADDRGVTALMLAANNDRTALLQTLLVRGAQVNARTQAGWTALTFAAWKGHVEIARRLLAAGADPSITDRRGWTPLQYAAWRAANVTRRDADAASSSIAGDPAAGAAAHLAYIDLVTLLEETKPPR